MESWASWICIGRYMWLSRVWWWVSPICSPGILPGLSIWWIRGWNNPVSNLYHIRFPPNSVKNAIRTHREQDLFRLKIHIPLLVSCCTGLVRNKISLNSTQHNNEFVFNYAIIRFTVGRKKIKLITLLGENLLRDFIPPDKTLFAIRVWVCVVRKYFGSLSKLLI